MKGMLSHLYNGRLREADRPVEELMQTQEYQEMEDSYKKMWKTFTEEQVRLFEDYYGKKGLYEALCIERAYANGVKTGFWLSVELNDFDLK